MGRGWGTGGTGRRGVWAGTTGATAGAARRVAGVPGAGREAGAVLPGPVAGERVSAGLVAARRDLPGEPGGRPPGAPVREVLPPGLRGGRPPGAWDGASAGVCGGTATGVRDTAPSSARGAVADGEGAVSEGVRGVGPCGVCGGVAEGVSGVVLDGVLCAVSYGL
ncbi:hypothetical protein GCM10010377_08520 [Streptomyces viridiviolaceus]|nr:hypothetical protein GCM10010377_08520 [Streptomyces viridiviolaceus]